MVDLALVLVGVWLLVSLVHAELRRREVELIRAKHRMRAESAQDRARAVEAELEGMVAAAPAADPLLAGPPGDPIDAMMGESFDAAAKEALV